MDDFLEIDVKETSSARLMEYVRDLKDNSNHHSLVAKIRKELVVRAMKENALSQRQVVKALTQSRDKRLWTGIAEEWCATIGLTKEDFLRIARGKTIDPSRR